MILEPSMLDKIDTLARRLDERKLESILAAVVDNLVQEVRMYAPIQDADNEAKKDIVTQNYKIAWDYAKSNYQRHFDLLFLTEVAGRVNPDSCRGGNSYAEWRTSSATLSGLRYKPPSDEPRIKNQLERLTTVIAEQQLHPVEESLLLHFHLTRIQPFDNGNKRTASIISNTILMHKAPGVHNFPPIYISPHERLVYTSLLNAALNGYEEASSTAQNPVDAFYNPDYQQRGYYDFLGYKVIQHLILAEDKLRQYTLYEIDLSAKEAGVYYRVKHEIDAFFKHAGVPHQVRLNRNGRNFIQVVGNISLKDLEHILSRNKRLQKYSVECKRINGEH